MKTNLIKTILAAGAVTAMTACSNPNSGGNNGGAPPPLPAGSSSTLTQAQHDALASAFIKEATAEHIPMTLVKTDTQQAGYVVTKDASGNLVAYYIDGWTAGTSVASYVLNGTAGQFNYFGVLDNGNGTFSVTVPNSYNLQQCNSLGSCTNNTVDQTYTLTFEAAQPSSKDLQKVAAFSQAYEVELSAKKVQQKFGLSLERSSEVAKLAIQIKNVGKMSNDDYDSMSRQLLGVPITKLDSAMAKTAAGDSSASNDISDIIDSAASTNGIGPEQARLLLNSLSGQISGQK